MGFDLSLAEEVCKRNGWTLKKQPIDWNSKDMELKSVKKTFKDKAFAAGCNRDIIRTGAERLGWDMDKLMEYTLKGMQADDRNA